jgi:hypothetical protein
MTTGSLTTASTAGTLTINGTLYYYGVSMPGSGAEISIPAFTLSLAGTGIGLFTSTQTASGGNSASLSAVALSPGSNSSASTSTSGNYPHATLTSIKGSAVGKYLFEDYRSASGAYGYDAIALIYIGTANTTYSVNFTGVCSSSNITGFTAYARNNSNSAGTLTVSGTLYE